MRDGGIAQLGESLPSMHKALSLIPIPHKLGILTHVCNSSTLKESRGSVVQGHLCLHRCQVQVGLPEALSHRTKRTEVRKTCVMGGKKPRQGHISIMPEVLGIIPSTKINEQE